MPDQLHPDQSGCDLMARAWFKAIQSIISPEGDQNSPTITRVRVSRDKTEVAIAFLKPVADSATAEVGFSKSAPR